MNDLSGYPTPFDKPLVSFSSADISGVLTIAFFVLFVIWVVYTLIVAYHWFRYGRHSWLAVPAICLHLFISVLLIFYIATGVH